MKDINLSINKMETVSIIGPSGGGKTTLLKTIAGLEAPTAGEVIFPNGRPITGLVFQDFNLWPHKTVLENVIAAPLLVKKIPQKKAIKEAEELLEAVGLAKKAGSYPFQLSGGEKQRVAIARSLAMNPKLLLLDEVTSNLDPDCINDLNKIVKKLAGDGFTLIISSHDYGFARKISDRVVFLDRGQIIESGPPSRIFEEPTKKRTKDFLAAVLEGY